MCSVIKEAYAIVLVTDTFKIKDQGLALLAEHQVPRVRPAICTAFVYRLAAVNRHMIV